MYEIPSVMRAAYITAHGPADAIEFGELPVPVLGPTDVLVRAEALAVNHVDTFVRSGAYQTHTPFPFVIGRDLVGTVAAVGLGVDNFRIGDHVWCNSLGHGGRQGSFAEWSSVPVERLYRMPDGVAAVDAVAVLHPAATAYLGLHREGGVRTEGTIVVTGAGGGVGSAVVQLAVAAGAKVIATASSYDEEYCLSLGAHAVIDYRTPDLMAAISEAAPEGVNLFWDNAGVNDIEGVLPVLAHGARIIVMSGLGSRPEVPLGSLYTRDISLRGFAISNASVSDLHHAAALINKLLATGRLRARIGATLPLSRAAQAHFLQAAQGEKRPKGRIIVHP
ncbi:NADPH:quinone reductase [Streptomyces sp. NE06-03E]|uniref:NADPH:quinone reductase n=1 Tax=unclassified Streptomyces TaxID=2593676 RepID=UPI0029BB0859|nr:MULTISPECIES: NADPH:quinone reductase [unclassified Streptomyces]MDX3054298.1 NADPH:quinone reductase [Streptomyces sp. NE06-03E]